MEDKTEITPVVDLQAIPKHTIDKIAKAVFDLMKKEGDLKGDKGAPGAHGHEGTPGAPGSKGDQGDIGPRGPKGDNGPEGEKGDRGIPGPAGEKGTPGPKGEEGSHGPIGQRGPEGEAGPKGDRGERGGVGPAGVAGPKGDPGIDGVAGSNYSVRARCTKPFNVTANEWTLVQFDAHDHTSGGYHSQITNNHEFKIVTHGCHYVSAVVTGAERIRMVLQNEIETKVIAEGHDFCFTDYNFKKYDSVSIQVWSQAARLIDIKGSASPVLCLRKVDRGG